jgi:hypothetical protein
MAIFSRKLFRRAQRASVAAVLCLVAAPPAANADDAASIAVPAEAAHRRPIRHRRWGRRAIERLKVARTVNDAAADHGEVARHPGDLTFGAGEEVAVRNDHIRELPDLDAAFLALLVGEPGNVLGPHPKRGLAIDIIALRAQAKPAIVMPVTSQASDTQGL